MIINYWALEFVWLLFLDVWLLREAMCGITGFIGKGNADTIRVMADTLRHRGPDEEGFFVDGNKRVHFGFRRLLIIDLTTGSQPIFNEDGTIAVVFNRQIYNFKKLLIHLE